jgi:hypothetical protein
MNHPDVAVDDFDRAIRIVGGRAAGAYKQAVMGAGGRCFENLHEFNEFIAQPSFS